MTKQEIRQRILRALNDDPVDPIYWTTQEIDEYVQDGMEMLAEESEALKRTYIVPRRPGVQIYHLAGIGEQIMVPYRIWLPDHKRRLEAWSITDIDGRQETWMNTTGSPWIWWPIDWQHFGIWPRPATGGNVMHVDCYVWPLPLLNESSQPEFYPADHEALVFFGEMEGYLKQHDVARAADLARGWVGRWASSGTRASVEQMQSAFHIRERAQQEQRD